MECDESVLSRERRSNTKDFDFCETGTAIMAWKEEQAFSRD